MTPQGFETDDMVYRWWITAYPDADAYALVILRYRRNTVDPITKYPPGECLSSEGEWVELETWDKVNPWLRIPGGALNAFFGAPDWREAVAAVVQNEILPHITALLEAMPIPAVVET